MCVYIYIYIYMKGREALVYFWVVGIFSGSIYVNDMQTIVGSMLFVLKFEAVNV